VYVSQGCPVLLIDEIREYSSKSGKTIRAWEDVFAEAAAFDEDDGHTVKFIRALKNGEESCKPFENGRHGRTDGINGQMHSNGGELRGRAGDDERWMIHGGMWRILASMVMDSVQPEYGTRWVRATGFQEAWKDVPARP
jgi:hypothetical protein